MLQNQLRSAIPLENLQIEALEPQNKSMFAALLLDENFQKAKTFREQVQIVCAAFRSDVEQNRVSFEEIGKFFGRSGASIYKQFKKIEKNPLPNGRPPILNTEVIEFIKEIIYNNFGQNTPVTYDLLLDAIQYRFQKSVKPDTLRHICRSIDGIKTVRGIHGKSTS